MAHCTSFTEGSALHANSAQHLNVNPLEIWSILNSQAQKDHKGSIIPVFRPKYRKQPAHPTDFKGSLMAATPQRFLFFGRMRTRLMLG